MHVNEEPDNAAANPPPFTPAYTNDVTQRLGALRNLEVGFFTTGTFLAGAGATSLLAQASNTEKFLDKTLKIVEDKINGTNAEQVKSIEAPVTSNKIQTSAPSEIKGGPSVSKTSEDFTNKDGDSYKCNSESTSHRDLIDAQVQSNKDHTEAQLASQKQADQHAENMEGMKHEHTEKMTDKELQRQSTNQNAAKTVMGVGVGLMTTAIAVEAGVQLYAAHQEKGRVSEATQRRNAQVQTANELNAIATQIENECNQYLESNNRSLIRLNTYKVSIQGVLEDLNSLQGMTLSGFKRRCLNMITKIDGYIVEIQQQNAQDAVAAEAGRQQQAELNLQRLQAEAEARQQQEARDAEMNSELHTLLERSAELAGADSNINMVSSLEQLENQMEQLRQRFNNINFPAELHDNIRTTREVINQRRNTNGLTFS